MTPSVTQDDINKALGQFLLTALALPSSQVIVGQVNRVSEPEGDFCIMWPLHRPRLATNVDSTQDVKFTGSIDDAVMTVTAVVRGTIIPGNEVFGVGVADRTVVLSQTSGAPGGIGVYALTNSQEVPSEVLSAGYTSIAASTEVVMQVDVHGPASTDNAQTIQQLLRDPYGVRQFEGTGVSPLYADDPKQMPFINAAKQYEDRWVVDVHLQVTPNINVPQEYADVLNVGLRNVPNQLPTS